MKFVLCLLLGCTLSGCQFARHQEPKVLLTELHNGEDASYIYWDNGHHVVYRFHNGILKEIQQVD